MGPMEGERGYTTLSIFDSPAVPVGDDALQWVPIRRRLDIGAFGVNAYRAAREGEPVIEDHAESYVKIFHSYRDIMISRLNAITFPTKDSPRWVNQTEIDGLQEGLAKQVQLAIVSVSKSLVADLEADRLAKDSPEAYEALYRQCSAADWKMKGT